MVRAKYPNLSAAEVIHRLTATADDKGTAGRDDYYGYGVINLVRSLTADVPQLGPSGTPRTTFAEGASGAPAPAQTGVPARTLLIVRALLIIAVLCVASVTIARRRRAQ